MSGTNLFAPETSQAVKIALTDESGNAILVKCATASIPSAVAGYAKGCELIDTTTGLLYSNTGTADSCTFTSVGVDTPGDIALTTGSILIGAAGVAAALDMKGNGKILIGNGTTAAAQSIGTDATLSNTGALTIANNAITSAKISSDVGKVVSVPLTAADINGMYAAPKLILAGVADKAIIVDSMEFDITRTATQFAGGGTSVLQYDSTVHGAGTATTAVIAAAVITAGAGRTITTRIPIDLSDVASASIIAKGLYLSNVDAAFTTGTGTATVTVHYHTI